MLSPSSDCADVIAFLQTKRSEENIAGMSRFGIATDETTLGISNAELRKIARLIKRNHGRAVELFETGIREARLLAAYTEEPKEVDAAQARRCATALNSWELVDSWADVLIRAGHGPLLIREFAMDEREFVRRMAFSMIAVAAVHSRKEPDAYFVSFLPLIEQHAGDHRNFVKKAVNWALRQIGKRSATCHEHALAVADRLATSPDKTARWIGKDAVRELKGSIALRKAGLEK